MRASVRRLRDYGLADEIDEIHAKLRKLKEEISKHSEAVRSGDVHHASVKDKHVAVMNVAKPLLDTSAMMAAVATVHGSHAKTIKTHAKKLAKYTGSVHAHLITAHADRIEKAAKAMKDIEKLAKKVDATLQCTRVRRFPCPSLPRSWEYARIYLYVYWSVFLLRASDGSA